MQKVGTQMAAGRLDRERARLRLNELLKGHMHIKWLGEFGEMLSGSHPFCQKMRAEFLGPGEQQPVAAIPSQDVTEFIQALRNYGH